MIISLSLMITRPVFAGLTGSWILTAGVWNDAGVWKDGENWND